MILESESNIKQVALYTRVSTQEQASGGFSLDSQIDRLRAYCMAREWKIFKEYVDPGYSGRNTKRPNYQQMLQDADVPVICQWSAGQFKELLPGMLEHGFNCTWPLERMAGMDGPDLRRSHGRSLLLGGNIAKEAVISGPEAIDHEMERLMPLIQEGGFIPAMDDMAPMECPFSHYRHMIERLQAIRLDG